jgi:hypothetical protein
MASGPNPTFRMGGLRFPAVPQFPSGMNAHWMEFLIPVGFRRQFGSQDPTLRIRRVQMPDAKSACGGSQEFEPRQIIPIERKTNQVSRSSETTRDMEFQSALRI